MLAGIKRQSKINIIDVTRLLLISTAIFTLLCAASDNMYASGYKIRTVVIDAGHGGKDPGAVSPTKYKEKTIALSVALKLGNYIKKNFPGIKVIYTRDKDVFVPLYERGEIANKAKADLFISIHANAFTKSTVSGTEVYVLGLHKTAENLEVAKRENDVILKEENYQQHYDYDPNSPEAHIMFSMFQDAFLDQSISFATLVDKQFKERVNRRSRGVRQAGFIVLHQTAMPSVLVELGYLTNPTEEKFLKTEQGHVYLASAIYRAFKEYKLHMENTNFPDEGLAKSTAETSTPTKNPPTESNNNITFRVQVVASPTKLSSSHRKLKLVEDYEEVKSGGYYRYMCGKFSVFEDAVNYQNVVKEKGIKDAFIVAYKNGERISVNQALAAIKN